MAKNPIEAHEGSGNIFADLGLPNGEERQLNSQIAAHPHAGESAHKYFLHPGVS